MSLLGAALVLGGVFLTSSTGYTSHANPVPATAGASGASTTKGVFAVGVRQYAFRRGPDRPLPTTVWYPAAGSQRAKRTKPNAPPAPGRFPLLLFSHGLHSSPQQYEQVTAAFARAGYVVVAPAYPYTRKDTPRFSKPDVVNQPLDASYVITRMLTTEPLASHIDARRMAATGHSAGGTTTNGLFTRHRDARLRAGIVIAGRPLGSYTGSPVPMLFVHGNQDPVVAYDQGRTAYAAVPWPKAFLTIERGAHGAGLGELERGHQQSMSTMLDFLRWALDGDVAARDRLGTDGAVPGVTHLESVDVYPSRSQSTSAITTTAPTATSAPGGSLVPAGVGSAG